MARRNRQILLMAEYQRPIRTVLSTNDLGSQNGMQEQYGGH
jgi:hypothetical protein